MDIKGLQSQFLGRNTSGLTKKCGFRSVAECPHMSEKDCKFDKTDCQLIAERKKKKHSDFTNTKIWLFIVIGVLAYVLITIISINNDIAFPYKEYICTVLSGVSISWIAGSLLSKVIDIPSRLKEYENSFINALASNSYLKSLDEQRLTRLRNDITEQLHKANAPCMASGLINIDQRICDLLRQPYYSRYRQSVICMPNHENSNYITKEHSIDYKLINPYSVNKNAIEYLSFSNLIMMEETTEEIENMATEQKAISDLKLSYQRDSDEMTVLEQNKDFTLVYEHLSQPKTEYYNTKVYLESINKKPTDVRDGIRVDFKDHLVVHMEYKIDVHIKDTCFTKRLRHPVKNFRLDYTCKDIDGELFGQIFGTELKQSDISIKYPTKHTISLETFDWLLPDNGAIVVLNSAKDLQN